MRASCALLKKKKGGNVEGFLSMADKAVDLRDWWADGPIKSNFPKHIIMIPIFSFSISGS